MGEVVMGAVTAFPEPFPQNLGKRAIFYKAAHLRPSIIESIVRESGLREAITALQADFTVEKNGKEKREAFMAVYFVLDIEKVTDPQKIGEYGQRGGTTRELYGVKTVVLGGASETIEGNWQPQGMVIFEFEDEVHFKRWYNSPEYQEILPLRLQGTVSRAILVQGV